MKINNKWLLSAFMLTVLTVFLAAGFASAAIDGGYVGSDACGACHTAQKADFDKSGHQYKVRFTKGLTPVASGGDNVTTITDPLSALLTPMMPLNANLINPNNEADVKFGTNLDWSTVSYVIGGWGWKARWGVKDTVDNSATGFIWSSSVSSPTGAQYNLETGTYSTYGSATKTYSCAVCHNTNGTSSIDAGCSTALSGTRTEPWASSGLAYTAPGGFRSEWTFSGVQCEACHGPGEGHAEAATIGVLSLNGGTVEICAKCHIRSNNTSPTLGSECGVEDSFPATYAILTKGATGTDPFIGHHEQYNEMHGLNNDGVHASLKCTDCHDPHKRAAGVISTVAAALGISNPTEPAMGAIRKQCGDCHVAQASAVASASASSNQGKMRDAGVTCADCHMAEASKTATNSPTTGWGRKGDLKTHIFKIRPTTDSIWRTNADGKNIAQNYLTPKYACGKCHDINIKPTAVKTYATEADAAADAVGYHNVTGIDNGYVGSEACAGCHTQNYNDFVQSGHPYKVRFTNGATPTSGTDPLSSILPTPLLSTLSTLTLNGLKVDDGSGNLDWSAASYVIGGFGWKARWGIKDTVNICDPADSTCKTGYIWTGAGAQFNMLAADATLDPKGHRSDWSGYNPGTDKKYSCAICHNTNGTSSTDALCSTALGSGRTEPWASTGLTTTASGGFRSEWTYSGVQCEACHGPAVNHVKSPSANTLGVLRVTHGANDYEICAKCHIRTNNNSLGYGGECGGDSNEAILTGGSTHNGAADGFESHHQQFNQVFGYDGDGAHASLECTACHNPHKRAATVTSAIATAMGITDNSQSAETRGAVVSCESCHPGKTLAIGMGDIKCVDCHMAATTKSATGEKATGTTDGIAAWGKSGDVAGHIFRIDPTTTTTTRINAAGKTIAANYITVDFACGKCHDPYMNDAIGRPALTQAQAQLLATNIHNTIPRTASFTWTPGAASKQVDFDASASACTNAPCTYSWNFGDGTTGTGVTTSRTYSAAGNYLVVVTVTDNAGAVTMSPAGSVTAASINVAPVAAKSITQEGFTVNVIDASTDDATLPAGAVTVDWGNGTTSTGNAGSTISKIYTLAGTYIIKHKVKDAEGKVTYSANQQVTVPVKYNVTGSVMRGVCSVAPLTNTTQALCTTAGGTWGPSASPVAGASVRLKNGATVVKMTTTNAAGAYTLQSVNPGSYTVEAVKSGLTFTGTPAAVVTNANVTGINITATR